MKFRIIRDFILIFSHFERHARKWWDKKLSASILAVFPPSFLEIYNIRREWKKTNYFHFEIEFLKMN